MLWTLTFHSELIFYPNLKRCDYYLALGLDSKSRSSVKCTHFSLHCTLISFSDWTMILQGFFPSHFRLPAVLPLCPGVLQRLRLLLVHLHVVHTLFIQQKFLETKISRKRDYIKHTAPLKHDVINSDMQQSRDYTIYKYQVLIFLKFQLLHCETLNTKGSRLSNQTFCIFFDCVKLISFLYYVFPKIVFYSSTVSIGVFSLFPAPVLYLWLPFGQVRGRRS